MDYLPHIIGIIYFVISACLFNLYLGRDCKIPVSIKYLRLIGLFLLSIFVFFTSYPFSSFSFISALLITLFIITLFFTILNYYQPIDYIGLILNPLILLVMILFIIIDFDTTGTVVDKNLYIHIIFSLSSYGLLVLAGMQALILRYQIISVKNIQHSSLLNSFPSIEDMEKIMYKLILSGFILLTFSLLSGIPYITNLSSINVEQKIIFSVIAWITFLYLIVKKYRSGVKDISAANLTIGGLLFLVIAYLGTKLLIS